MSNKKEVLVCDCEKLISLLTSKDIYEVIISLMFCLSKSFYDIAYCKDIEINEDGTLKVIYEHQGLFNIISAKFNSNSWRRVKKFFYEMNKKGVKKKDLFTMTKSAFDTLEVGFEFKDIPGVSLTYINHVILKNLDEDVKKIAYRNTFVNSFTSWDVLNGFTLRLF